MAWTINPKPAPPGPWPAHLDEVLSVRARRRAAAEIRSWQGYAPTPLRRADVLAARLGLGAVRIKDESGRFGLGSFKALGGAYGVRRVLPEGCGGGGPGPGDGGEGLAVARRAEAGRADAKRSERFTVATASDGNHGRAVAWGARMFGCDAVVYLPSHVTEARAEAIRALGARVTRVAGEYDDAVARADRDARRRGWTVVSDTSYPGYMDIPRWVMAGYAVMVEEALAAMGAVTHVFVQGGVGGLAAAAIGHLWTRLGPQRPTAVVVEPESADGLYRSALAGEPRASAGDLHTIMAGLSCREVSPLAWEVVGAGAYLFMTVGDDGIPPLMREAARGTLGEPFEGGESGVAGLLGLVVAAADPALREAAGLNDRSRVLIFNTEGATDPELHARIVGVGPAPAESRADPTPLQREQ